MSVIGLCRAKRIVDSADGCHNCILKWRAEGRNIYMQQPEGYAIPGIEHMVCKLKKYKNRVLDAVTRPLMIM